MTDADASRGYLSRAVRRMRMKIDVWYDDGEDGYFMAWPVRSSAAVETWSPAATAAEATRAYLTLCAELDPEAV